MAAATVAAAFPLAAGAHVGGGALILLLPTHLYVAGGALVVVASFVLVALVPARLFARLESTGIRVEIGRLPGHGALSTTLSLLSLGVAIGLLLAGVLGSRDPLRNPLPLFVWTVWWVGLASCRSSWWMSSRRSGPPRTPSRWASTWSAPATSTS
ncbi:MAG: hypothetical protein HYY95_26745 [Candidatus Rokubacteria bacterium]|nr:hypothetical protein [Candidatus Rokubacteria bacterium]